MEMLWQDVRFGGRMLARNPGFSLIIVVILAIGIGATTALLSVVDAVLFRPCPYTEANHLVWVCETDPGHTRKNMVSLPNFCDWRRQSRTFEQLVAANRRGCVVRGADRIEKSNLMSVSPDFFSVLGVEPIVGRTFLPEEERPGGPRVVILSEAQWQHWFAGDPNALGKTLVLDREAYTVVGVLPEEFRWALRREPCGLWTPLALESVEESRRASRGTDVVGKLKPGVGVSQAQAEMDVIADRLARAHPEVLAEVGILVVPMNEAYRIWVGRTANVGVLMILLGIVGGVLLVACLHVASLLMARSMTREREIAVRAALGAHRLRLIRQLLTESALLAGLGGLLGLLLAHWGVHLLAAVRGNLGALVPWFVEPHNDSRSLVCALIVSLATCGLFGALPAFWTSRIHLSRFLSAPGTCGGGPRLSRVRAALAIGDLSVAFVLLVLAGLVIKSYTQILRFDPGVEAKNVLTMEIEFDKSMARLSQPDQRSAFFQQVLARTSRLPDVQCAAVANVTPAWAGYNQSIFQVEGRPAGEDQMIMRRTTVSPDYFRLLQIPLLKGRGFTESETAAGAAVAIINESLANRLWPGQDPVGRCIYQVADASGSVPRQIVGVVGDVKHYLKFFLPLMPEQARKQFIGVSPDDVVYVPGYENALMVRMADNAGPVAAAVRRAISSVDEEAMVSNVSLLEEDITALFWLQRFNMIFLGVFAGVALILASLGVYGAMAYTVSRRTHEIGVRMALGAKSGDVLKALLGQSLRLTGIALAIGLLVAGLVTRVISRLLQDVSPTDPLTFACVALLLAGVALAACYLPARRAAKIDPMAALRYE
jgi:predicted permease